MIERRAAIYVLSDPSSGLVRYVGKSVSPRARFLDHIAAARTPARNRFPVTKWIAKLLGSGTTPEMRVIEHPEDWEEAERRWIKHYRDAGAPLLNIEDGGSRARSSAPQFAVFKWCVRFAMRRRCNALLQALMEAFERAASFGADGIADLERELEAAIHEAAPLKALGRRKKKLRDLVFQSGSL